jgi:hypothetical protein
MDLPRVLDSLVSLLISSGTPQRLQLMARGCGKMSSTNLVATPGRFGVNSVGRATRAVYPSRVAEAEIAADCFVLVCAPALGGVTLRTRIEIRTVTPGQAVRVP